MKRKTKKQKFAVILAILLLVSSLGESVSVESMQTETDGTEETQDDKAEVKAAGATEETAASQAGTDKAEVGQAFISDENRSDSVASVSEDTNGEAEDDTESDSSNDGDGDTEEQITEVASGTCGTNVTWVLTSDGTLTIDGTGEMSDYSTYSYAKNYAPWYSYDVKYVVIDEGVTTIGSGAFYACTSLTSVSIPDTVTEIGRMAFGITAITSLTIPDSVTTIGAYAFWYSDLVSVTIPSSVEEYEYAFISCHWLESVVLSEGITKIDADAFSSCSSLTSVSIPSSVEEIGVGAFEDCVALVSITIPSGVTLIGNAAFQGCDSLESISLPESLTSIGRCAFVGCNSLKNISLPSGLTELGYRAFYASALTSITIPSGITSMGEEVFAYSYDLSDVYISEGCTILGERAFYECYSIQSITLPSSLTDYEGAFEVCSGLESVILSDGIGLVDEWAFYGCVSLTNISFPDSLTSIGEYAFSQSGLMQIDLSSGVESIGAGAFSFCDDLKSVTLSEGLVTIGKYAFKYDMALSTVRMDAQENALTVIEEGAFYYCCSLVEINLPDGLESIGAWALYGTSIEEITIPEGVSTLGDGVFYKCESLTKITFEGCAPEIGDDIFYEVTANAYCHEYLGWNEDNMLDYGGDITWNVISASFVDGYDFEKDSYSFECYNVYFTAKKYFTTMYESGTGSALYELKKGSLASGVCVGMSYTTASIFNGYPSAADIVSSGIMRDIELNSKVTIGNNTIKLKDYIKYASIYQWSSEYWEDDDNTRGTDADTLLQLIKVMTDSDIMGMIVKFRQVELDENGEYYNTLWSHLVTVVGYSGNTLLIDDSNYRDELQTLTLHSNGC